MRAAAPSAPALVLRSRVVLAGAGLMALLAMLAALAFVAYKRRELHGATLARAELFARVLEDQSNRTFNGVEVALGAAVESVQLQRSNPDPDAAARLSPVLRQSLQALPFLRSISLVDWRGAVLASSNPDNLGRVIPRRRLLVDGSSAGLGPLLPGRDLADLDESAGARQSNAASLLPLVRPLEAGAKAEWMVATVNPDYFANQYQMLLDGTPFNASLLSYGGQLLVPGPGSQLAAGPMHRGHSVFKDYLPGREHGEFMGPGLDGKSAYTAFRTARRQPLVVVVEIAEAGVAAELNRMALTVAAGTAGLLLLMGALSLLAWRGLRGREAVSGDLAVARGSLAAQDAFTDRLFQVSPIPMVVKDSDGRFVRVNKAWTDLTGMAPERVIGVNLGRLYPAQMAAPHEVQEQMAIASGQPVSYEEQILDNDGLPRDVMIRVMPYTDAAGAVVGVISCLTDVTEFREVAQRTLEAKDAAERANAAKSEFLANISHELRTPLQSILGFSELGGMRARAEPRLQSMFGDIHRAGQRMLTLVNNLLDLSRLESVVGEVALAAMDIRPALRAVVQELAQMAQSKGLQLALPADDEAPGLWAAADDFRLQQVLRNVLANAIRFAPAGSTITLDWRRADARELLVSVRDHGPGIPADELESIFESFVQSTRTKDGSGGTGLGLAICRKIMDAHHGRVSAGNHPQGGAVFEIRLPALEPPAVARPTAAAAGLPANA